MSNVDTSKLRAIHARAPSTMVEPGSGDIRVDADTFYAEAHAALRALLTELDKLRALLDTPWPEGEEGNEPKPITFRGGERISFFVPGVSADFLITAPQALELGAALIRAASTESK